MNGFFTVIFKMPKRILLQILIPFRQTATAISIKVALVVFQLDVILSLPIYSLSAFLQYCLELLIYSRQQLTMNQVQEVGREVLIFLECLIKNCCVISESKYPLLYVYPKVKRTISFFKKEDVKKMLTNII